jgi:hypothetical protein
LPATPPPPGTGARILVDTSGSMKGFVVPGSVALETIHRVIDETLSKHGMNQTEERCLLGTQLSCDRALKYPELRDPKLYGSESSRLDLALLRPVKGPDENPAAPPPKDNLDPYRIVLLITDGVQAAQGVAGSFAPDKPVSAKVACATGADPACVGALLAQRVFEGFGLWVISLRLPFSGAQYAERGLDKSHWAQIQAHLAELKKAPEWYGMKLSVAGLSTEKAKGTSFYQYNGAKPLLFFVLSRDLPAARAFVADLVARLQAEKLGRPEQGSLNWMEVAPLGGQSYQWAGVGRLEGPRADKVLLDPPKVSGTSLFQPVRCSAEGAAYLDVKLQITEQEPKLPPNISETIALVPGERTLDPKILKRPEATSPGHFKTGINCTFLSPGQAVADFRLVQTRQVVAGAPADAWWVQLSAENTFEFPEKVYGLQTIVEQVLRTAFTAQKTLGHLRVAIDRQ